MTTAEQILQVARGELGYKESPAGSNRTKYGAWFGLNGQPWCMMFVQWCFRQADAQDLLPALTASCGAFMRSAQAAGRWVTGGYQPGDVVIYDFPGGAATDHCGIVESVTDSGVIAIEGNTGSGSDADGGQVQRRTRPLAYVVGAVRPLFEEEENVERFNTVQQCPAWAQPTVEKLVKRGYLGGSGKKDEAGNPADLDLSRDMLRLLVIQDRAGCFGA